MNSSRQGPRRGALGLAALALSCCADVSAPAETCAGEAVPFTRFGPEATALHITVDARICVVADGKALDFGTDVPVFESVSARGARIYYTREPLTSALSVHAFDGEGLSAFDLPEEAREALHAEHAFAVGGQHVLIAYNVETSSPSGRRFDLLREGLSVWTADPQAGTLTLVPEIEMAGGIDANLHSVDHAGGRLLCLDLACSQIQVDGAGALTSEPAAISLDAPDFTPVLAELASDGTTAFALVKRDYDDRFHGVPNADDAPFFICPVGATAACKPWMQAGTPYDLRIDDGVPRVSVASTSAERAALLRFDLTRLRQTGVSYLGENNTEGRIAWGGVYYNNGLTTLAADQPGLGADFAALARDARTRLRVELDFVAALAGTGETGLATRRYSLGRERIPSLLMGGRIGRMVLRAEELGVYTHTKARQALHDQMLPRPAVLEVIKTDARTGEPQMRLRRGMPFWSDGSNVPWNYQSGWIDGLAHLDRVRPELTQDYAAMVPALLTPFLDEELSDQPDSWRYAGGVFHDGWTAADDISTNTPDYAGNKTNTTAAHVSYRSMDAMALIEAERAGWVTLPPDLRAHLQSLVDRGWLYPFVMEALAPGGADYGAPEHVRQSHRRVVNPYEVQSAPWVMTP